MKINIDLGLPVLVITLVLVVLKAFGYIAWSWLIVFMPVLICLGIIIG